MLIEIRDLICQDPEAKKAGEIARFAHGAVKPVLGMTFTQIEDLDERRAFTERCIAAACSGSEPMAVRQDVFIYCLLLMEIGIR
jgi:hypothetical protein